MFLKCNKMESGKGLGLVAIVAVMFWGVAEADNPCYYDCFKDCTTAITCMFNPQCIATCGITCGLQDTCKHGSRKVLRNSAEPQEAVVIHKDTIEKNFIGVVAGNPCYAECVQDCLNTCSFVGCAACPAICSTHDTCKNDENIKIKTGKREEAVAIQSDTIEKKSFGVVGGNPCYAECTQDCLNNCGLSPVGCATCPVICGMHNTCKDIKNIEINSGNIAKSHVGVAARNALGQNSVADE